MWGLKTGIVVGYFEAKNDLELYKNSGMIICVSEIEI